jgi:hypothetical protein
VKAIIVGEFPQRRSYVGEHSYSGRRLAELLGVANVADVAHTANLFEYRIPTWSKPRARGAANRLLLTRAPDRWVLCGRRVVEAFEIPETSSRWLSECVVAERRVLVFPHPSGISRFWNDPANVERAARALRRFVCPTT